MRRRTTKGTPDDSPAEQAPIPRIVWVLSAIAFCVAIGYGIVAPAVPGFARQFGVGRTAAAAVVSVFAFARLLAVFGTGRLVDRFGTRQVLGAGLVIVALSSAAAATSQTYGQLLLLRGVGGFGSAMFSVASASAMASGVPNAVRGRAMGIYQGAFLLGGVAGPVLGGPLTAVSLRLPFAFYAGTLAVAAVISYTSLAGPPRSAEGRSDGDPAAREGVRVALGIPLFRAAIVGNLTGGWANALRVGTIPLFVTEALHRGPAVTGAGLTLYAAVNGLCLWPAGRISDRWGRRPAMISGALITSGSILLLALPPALPVFLIAMVVGGVGASFQSVGPASVAGDVASGRRGSVIATYQVAGDVGVIFGPLIANSIVDVGSYPAAFLTTAGVVLVAALAAAAVRRPRS